MPSTTSTVTRRLPSWSRRPPTYGEHVSRLHERVEPHVAVLAPRPRLAGQLVVDLEGLPRLEAERGHVEVHRGLAHRVRVEVDHHEHAVVPPSVDNRALRPGDDLVVVRLVPAKVPELAQSRVVTPDVVEPRQQRCERAARGLGRRPVARAVLELLAVEVLLAARPDRDVLEQLEAGV